MTGPVVGEIVCTCRYRHERITAVDEDGDTVTTQDGWQCSYRHCCTPADHEPHPELVWPPE